MSFWVPLVATLGLELYVLRRLRFDGFVVALVLGSTLLWANYLSYTSIEERNYDGASQLFYIQALSQNLRLPNVYDCGICGHPPLYYALGALWSKAVLAAEWIPLERGLQWLSVLMSFGFAVFALLIFRSCLPRPWPLRFAAALLLFWPSSVLNSVRVHNDALCSLLMVAAMYFTARWDAREREEDFYAALAFASLALLTKASGYTVVATFLLFVVVKLRSARFRRVRAMQCIGAVIVLGTAAVLAVSFRQSRAERTDCQVVLGLACDSRYVPAATDNLRRYMCFDPVDFVSRTEPLPDKPEHDYFLNRFGKSSLFGVSRLGDKFSAPRYRVTARVLSALLLAMVAISVAALPWLRNVRWRKYRTYLVGGAIMFAFLVAFRVRAPNEFHEDFRHIFPALVPICLGYAAIVERMARCAKVFGVLGAAIGLSVVLCSVAFFARLP